MLIDAEELKNIRKEYMRQYGINHREKHAEASLRYYYNHKEKALTAAKKWQKQNRAGEYLRTTLWKKNRRQLITDLKSNCCCPCGEAQIEKLVFHHEEPATKIANIARLIETVTVEELWDELCKCVILCNSCHSKLHRAIERNRRRDDN